MRGLHKNSLRNLPQYKDLSDEEFESLYLRKITNAIVNDAFEKRIKEKLDEFSQDYDLSDLNANDKLSLRNLAQVLIQIEDLEQLAYSVRSEGLDSQAVNFLGKINEQINALSDRASKLQNDLNITRKSRKSDKEQSLVDFIEDLKNKANEFYQQKMYYVFCPKCNLLLATAWFLNPDDERNRVIVYCNREVDGVVCGERVVYRPASDNNPDMTNNSSLLPEGMT